LNTKKQSFAAPEINTSSLLHKFADVPLTQHDALPSPEGRCSGDKTLPGQTQKIAWIFNPGAECKYSFANAVSLSGSNVGRSSSKSHRLLTVPSQQTLKKSQKIHFLLECLCSKVKWPIVVKIRSLASCHS